MCRAGKLRKQGDGSVGPTPHHGCQAAGALALKASPTPRTLKMYFSFPFRHVSRRFRDPFGCLSPYSVITGHRDGQEPEPKKGSTPETSHARTHGAPWGTQPPPLAFTESGWFSYWWQGCAPLLSMPARLILYGAPWGRRGCLEKPPPEMAPTKKGSRWGGGVGSIPVSGPCVASVAAGS